MLLRGLASVPSVIRPRVTIVGSTLGTISDLAATAGVEQVVLTWTAATDATSHQPQYKETTSGTWLDFGSALNGSATTVTVTGLTASTGYDFRVVASDGVATTDSNTDSATPTAGDPTPDYEQLWEFADIAALKAHPDESMTYSVDLCTMSTALTGTPWGGSYAVRRPCVAMETQTVGYQWAPSGFSANHFWMELYVRFDTNWHIVETFVPTHQSTDDKTFFFLRGDGTQRWEMKFINGSIHCQTNNSPPPGYTGATAWPSIPGGEAAQCDGNWHQVRTYIGRDGADSHYWIQWDGTTLAQMDFTWTDASPITWFTFGANFGAQYDSWMEFGRFRLWTSDPGWSW